LIARLISFCLFATKAKEMLANFTHLDLFGTFGDSVAPVMAVDVFEGHMSAVTDSPARLHCSISGVTDQPVRAVIAHRDQVCELHKAFNVGPIALD
jgi:hypothetical protein